jgi:creatinine amidohydrolase
MRNIIAGATFVVAVLSTGSAAQQPKGLLIERLSWDEAKAHLTANAIVVIPLGAQSKEHGRHLPLNNDWLMAEYYKTRVMQAAEVIVYPTINYHYYPAFRPFPGSTMMEQTTARDMTADIVRSIAGHGPRKFYIVNTGVSTIAPLKAAQALLKLEDIDMQFTDILSVAADVAKKVSKQQEGTHADEMETSAMLYIAPDVVRLPKAARDYRRLRDQWPLIDSALSDAATGVYGDPTLATREKGQAIVEARVAGILREIEALRRAPAPR